MSNTSRGTGSSSPPQASNAPKTRARVPKGEGAESKVLRMQKQPLRGKPNSEIPASTRRRSRSSMRGTRRGARLNPASSRTYLPAGSTSPTSSQHGSDVMRSAYAYCLVRLAQGLRHE
jgi:hypothetical protein